MVLGLNACRTPVATPKSGPPFVIDSPAPGASIAGTVVFAVQPADPSAVQSVTFKAGSKKVATVSSSQGPLRTFLSATDFPAGPLTLTAIVTGSNGGVTTQTVNVTNVPKPPSSTTLGAGGAVVGTTEASGSLSTLALPAGVGKGATLSFAAETKAQVKAATGVDYDALGVTFLGAQQIDTSRAITAPLTLSSGGFGPQVQPGQAVVNYSILPDMNGDSVGELVVTNTASVAPDGDVVSDPVPQVVLTGQGASTSALRTSGLHPLSAGFSGPPGTVLTLQGSGFNPVAGSENHAVFVSSVDGSTITLPLMVLQEQQGAAPKLLTSIPPLPTGGATLRLVNTTSGYSSSPIAITVTASPALKGSAASIIDGFFTQASSFVQSFGSGVSGIGTSKAVLLSKLAKEQNLFHQLEASADPQAKQTVQAMAQVIQNSGVVQQMSTQGVGLTTAQVSTACAAASIAMAAYQIYGMFGTVSSVLGWGLCAATLIVGGEGCVIDLAVSWAVGKLKDAVVQATYNLVCLSPCPAPVVAALTGTATTGMGSVLPGGGSVCGVVGAPPPSSASATSQPGPTPGVPAMKRNRFVLTLQTSSGSSPFTAVTDPSGYFYFPAVPAGQPFTLTAVDVATNTTRTVHGTGADLGASTTAYPNFFDPAGGSGSGLTALFTASADPSAAYATYHVDASATYDPSGSITSYTWDFGDGSTPTADTVPYATHQYMQVGTYTATLTVVDGAGGSGSAQQGVTVGAPPPAAATRVDLAADGSQADQAAMDQQVGIDGTGAHVSFWSLATTLGIPNDQGAGFAGFLSDVQVGTLVPLDPWSHNPSLLPDQFRGRVSGDGSLWVFAAQPFNVAGPDGIWLWNSQSGTLTEVDTAADGTAANGGSMYASISSDGRYVAFTSDADNLVPNDANGFPDVFVKDLQTGAVVRASDPSVGAQIPGGSFGEAVLSPNGDAVAFQATTDDVNTNVYVRDLTTQALTLVDATASGTPATVAPVAGSTVPLDCGNLSLSSDGRYVAFTSNATNLAPNTVGVPSGLYVKDVQSGTITRADVSADGTTDSTAVADDSLSGDGRFVVFEAQDDILPSDTNMASDVYVKDLVSGTLAVVSTGLGGHLADGASTGPAISTDGRVVAFVSGADNLVPFDSNGVADVFVAPNPLAP